MAELDEEEVAAPEVEKEEEAGVSRSHGSSLATRALGR